MVTGGGRGRVSGLAEQMWAKDTILDNNVKMGAECAAACTIFYREYILPHANISRPFDDCGKLPSLSLPP